MAKLNILDIAIYNIEIVRAIFSTVFVVAFLSAILPACTGASSGPPAFSISNMELEPKSPHISELFSVSFTLTNSGGSRGEYRAELKITRYISLLEEEAGSTMSFFKTTSVAPGQSQTVVFESITLMEGLYKARIEDQLKTFEVGC